MDEFEVIAQGAMIGWGSHYTTLEEAVAAADAFHHIEGTTFEVYRVVRTSAGYCATSEAIYVTGLA